MSAMKMLKKSALAIAIASASLSAYSETAVLSDSQSSYKAGNDLLNGLTVTGNSNFGAILDSDEIVVSVVDKNVTGDIVLDAKISMSGPNATGLEVGSETKKVVVDGDIINKGEINFNGDIGWGIGVYAGNDDNTPISGNTIVYGSIINDGTISIKQSGPLAIEENDPAIGIEISFTDLDGDRSGSYIGGIYNNNKIELSGDNVTGIYATNDSYADVIENAGSITASGKNVRGIHVDHGSDVDQIENKGTISVTSTGVTNGVGSSGAIVVQNSTVDAVDNRESGVINVSGADVSGIYLENTIATWVGNDGKIVANNGATAIKVKNSEITHIDNDGIIEVSGEGAVGIYLDGALRKPGSPYNIAIDNEGTIRATDGALAIKVENANVTLEWDKGLIDGDVQGLGVAVIDEQVTFSGSNFESGLIRVGFGDDEESLPTVIKFTQAHTQLKTNSNNVEFNGVNIAGGLRVAEDARLAVEISSKTDASKAIIAVDGSAEFGKGSGINVSSAKGLTIDGKEYILLSTTGELVTDKDTVENELFVTSGSKLLKVNSYVVNELNGKVTANVSVESDQVIIDAVVKEGASKNAQAVAKELGALAVALPETSGLALQKAVETLGIAAVAEQLSADVSTGAGAAQAAAGGQTIITGATSSRTSSLRGKSSGEALKETGVWVQTLYSDAKQGQRDGIKGYNAYSSGLAIGADGKPTDDVTVGVAYSYLDSTVNGKSGNTTDVKGHAFTLYGGYELGNYFVDGNLTYSANTNDSKRNVLGTVAKGDYDSNMLGASVTGGYTFKLDNNIVLEPLVTARYANIKIDSFSEKGSAYGLKTNSQRYEIAELGVGARVATNYALGQGTLEPQVQVMALHDLAADQTKSTSAFIAGSGNPFVASGAKPVRNSYEASVGADYRLGALTFGANYGYTGKSGFNSDTFSAKVRYDF